MHNARIWSALALMVAAPSVVWAADAGPSGAASVVKPAVSAAASGAAAAAGAAASASPSSGAAATAPGTPGIPAAAPEGDEDEDAPGQNPHAGQADAPSLKAPQDGAGPDPALPFGTIDAEIRDGSEHPRANVPVTLAVIQNSVAKGENRKQLAGMTDANGHVRWDKLEGGSQMSYRVSVSESGGMFDAPPFNLDVAKGMRVLLHTFPVTTEISKALVVMQAILYIDLKDDRVQAQQAYNVYNFGKVAWAPKDFILPLPDGFTALSGADAMSGGGQTVEAVEGKGARLQGTFGPGRHAVEYRWQLPYGGESNLDLSVNMPPNLAAARVMVVSAPGMKITVDGFPTPQPSRDGQGNNIVETERELRREEAPMKVIHVQLRDIPVPGPGRYYASAIAAVAVALGLTIAFGRKRSEATDKSELGKERTRLLAELESLERARRDGDVGPSTYENARRALIDDLARTFATPAKSV